VGGTALADLDALNDERPVVEPEGRRRVARLVLDLDRVRPGRQVAADADDRPRLLVALNLGLEDVGIAGLAEVVVVEVGVIARRRRELVAVDEDS